MDLEQLLAALEERIQELENENKKRELEIEDVRINLNNFMYNGDP